MTPMPNESNPTIMDSISKSIRNFPVVAPNTFWVLTFLMRIGEMAVLKLVKLMVAISRMTMAIEIITSIIWWLVRGVGSYRAGALWCSSFSGCTIKFILLLFCLTSSFSKIDWIIASTSSAWSFMSVRM